MNSIHASLQNFPVAARWSPPDSRARLRSRSDGAPKPPLSAKTPLGQMDITRYALVGKMYKQIVRKLFGFIRSKLQRGMGKERRKADRVPANNTIIVEHEGQIYSYSLRDINSIAFAFLVGHGNDLDVGFTDIRKVSIVVRTPNAEKIAKCKVRLLRVNEDFCTGMDLVVMEYKPSSMYSGHLIDKYILQQRADG